MEAQSQSQPPSAPPDAKPPKRRTRRGCLTCRRRKVKCDERPDCCYNCDRLKLECTWDPRAGERVQRSRKSRACSRCRDKKLRCLDVESPQGCRNCIEAGAQCNPPASSETSQSRAAARVPDPEQCRLPNRHELLSLLESFFAGPHYFCYYTFIRRRAYTEMLENDLIPRPLLLIISATALRCRDMASSLPDKWADEARELVVRDVFCRMSTANLQTVLLLQRYEWHRGSHLGAWFLSGLAIRLATGLQLFNDPSETRGSMAITLPTHVMETRRRLMWSCFAMDSIPDAGDRPTNSWVEPDSIKARLPCDEASYEAGVESAQVTLHDPVKSVGSTPSVSAYLIRAVFLRLRMLQYSYPFYPQSVAKQHTQAPWASQSPFYRWRAKLEEFRAALMEDFPLESSYLAGDQSHLVSLFTVHVMFHAAYTDLLRAGTHKTPRGDFEISETQARSFFDFCRRGRIEHALRISEIVSACMNSACEEYDPFMAICSCLALRILVAERVHDGGELVDLTDPAIVERLNYCRSCAINTAIWSRPIRRLLFAVSDLISRHGYDLKLSESPLELPSRDPPPRPGTPGLQIYGTAGIINKAREDHDLESAASHTDRNSMVTPSSDNPATNSGSADSPPQQQYMNTRLDPTVTSGPGPFLQDQNASSYEDLQIAYNWSNGVYDWEPARMDMGWADFDLRWSYGQDPTAWVGTNDWEMDEIE